MKKFKIATWNVNSLRVRIPHVLTWLADVKPDVLALQEIKLTDLDFPYAALQEAGYSAVAVGQKAYNGVAILSRLKATDIVTSLPNLEDLQRRLLGATLGEVRVINLYVPNGESLTSEKYQYKLNWLKSLDVYLQAELKKFPKLVVLGDFNIAPEEIDVHDPKRWAGQVLVSVAEREAFSAMLKLGLRDCFRQHAPTEKLFTWWDYRLNAFKRDMGLRIDHILASPALFTSCTHCYIDKAPRAWERPSDHAPVIAEFNLSGA